MGLIDLSVNQPPTIHCSNHNVWIQIDLSAKAEPTIYGTRDLSGEQPTMHLAIDGRLLFA